MNKGMNKGFTLIELIAVVTLIALISLIAIPNITKNVKEKKIEISEANQKILTAATDTYIQNNQIKYNYSQEADGSIYCIPIQSLIDNEILQTPFKDVNGVEIDYSAQVKATYQSQYNSFQYELVERDGCQEIIQYVSRPQLAENMIPVIYDESSSTWKKADKNSNWYNYSNKNWANAVLVKENKGNETGSKSRQEYLEAQEGTTILESDILAQFVWIPRYRYQLFNSSTQTQINIVFESTTTEKSNGTAAGAWLTHPAFTYNNQELSGIWVSKYEASNQNNNIIIKPNQTAWTDIDFAETYEKTVEMTYKDNIYGLKNINTHMTKNSEWGAAAYLTNSKYGNLENNSSTGNITGIYNLVGSNEYVIVDNENENSLGYALNETKTWTTDNTYTTPIKQYLTRGANSIFNYTNEESTSSTATYRISLINTEKQQSLADAIPPCNDGLVSVNDYIDFEYTGEVQTFVACKNRIYKLEVWGAQGGTYSSYAGGKGGYSTGNLTADSNQLLYVYIGEQPTTYLGGWNGGGRGISNGRGGGGASDIRIGEDSLYARVIVAGGGGGSGVAYSGGYGGGLTGGNGYTSSNRSGTGGTQTAGGTTWSASYPGSFGQGGNTTGGYSAGGGGGGWYGGGGAYDNDSDSDGRGGGGGSGYVYTSSTASNCPTGCLLNSNFYLKTASTKDGSTAFASPNGTQETGHTGNGYGRITYIGEKNTSGTTQCTDDGLLAIDDYIDFNYTGAVQTFTACPNKKYKLEVWGAQGGGSSSSYNTGGYGGYSYGEVVFSSNTPIYIYVGQVGGYNITTTRYNGGGLVSGSTTGGSPGGSGGGATHIAVRTGLLSELSSYISDILIVAGGGGGAGGIYSSSSSSNNAVGGQGGGYIGGGGSGGWMNSKCFASSGSQCGGGQNSIGSSCDQCNTNTYASFGLGGKGGYGSNSSYYIGGGGGGGLYGGNGAGSVGSGAGGSGYIGSSSLTNKGMYMYSIDCTSSTATDTKTTCTSNVSSTATSNYAKQGDGYARITYVE